MYALISEKPTKEDIKIFKIKENSNENFISYKIDPNILSQEEKTLLIDKYKLDKKAYNYKDFIFLSIPVSTVMNDYINS